MPSSTEGMNWRGMAPPTISSMKAKPLAARLGRDGHMHIAELPVAAALALEAGMLGRAAADRFLVFDLGPAGLDRQVVFEAQPVGGDLQMDLALAPEHELMGVRLMHHRQRRDPPR